MPPKFVPRQRKHKAIARQKSQNNTTTDANATEILPASAAEREARRDALRSELRAQQPESKVTGKKRKRLDKYIDTKLKKEENLALIKKLAAHKVDTSLFQSAKKLGRGGESQRERLEKALREREAGLNIEANDRILLERRPEPVAESESEDEDEEAAVDGGVKVKAPQPQLQKPQGLFQSGATFGSGLKRPLELDEEGKPIIKKRKRTKIVKASPVVVEPEWDGFSEEEDGTDASDADMDDEERTGWDEISSGSEPSEDEEDEEGEGEEEGSSDEEEESEDESSGDESATSASSGASEKKKARSSAFKAWATQQRNTALGFTPSQPITSADQLPPKPANFVPRAPSPEALPPELTVPTEPASTARPAVSEVVPRTPEIQEARMQLPVVQEEQKIIEAIGRNDVIVVWGATGSGKTTQVPQMMFENGYGSNIGKAVNGEANKVGRTKGMIGVTQPRRVAATSVAARVATEMGEMKNRVGHQIQFDKSVTSSTAIKFMTDGILLREISQDFILSKYSAIIIDEAHERSVNTDILIGMMSRIVDLRAEMAKEKPDEFYPLKLVIMSATLRVEDFTKNQRLFRHGPPPIVQAEGRQYPVTDHFSRRTQRDYVEEMFQKVSRGHKKLPPGAMLVFMTGQNEITTLAKRLRSTHASTGEVKHAPVRSAAQDMPLEDEDFEDPATDGQESKHGNEDFSGDESDDEIHGLDDDDEFDVELAEGETVPTTALKLHVLPLYSNMPSHLQMRVFEPPPDGTRLVVLATNVAETSLTIPGVRYVFDCGRVKEKKYEPSTGVQTFEIGWISKASAAQRAGRAGRTGPGHCYRLYSSAVFERDFEEYTIPEILRSPIESVVLSLKSMDIHAVVNFPFPTPPDRQALAKAEKLLTYLGALDARGNTTDTGRALASYPLSPRFGRMLYLGQREHLIQYTIALVAALAVPELFVPMNQLQNQLQLDSQEHDDYHTDSDSDSDRPKRSISIANPALEAHNKAYSSVHHRLSGWDPKSDAFKLLTAFAMYLRSPTTACDDFFLREKGMTEASMLRGQLASIARKHAALGDKTDMLSLPPPPNEKERAKLRQILTAGFIDQIAIRADKVSDAAGAGTGKKPRRAIEVPYRTLFPSHDTADMAGLSPEEKEERKLVYVHPSSVLAKSGVKTMPEFVVYSHLSRSGAAVGYAKARMHPLTTISGKELARLAEGTPLLEIGKPVGKIEQLPRGDDGRERRRVMVGLTLRGSEGMGWPVDVRGAVQKRVGGVWEIERWV
ncbi:putative ATP-dependent RNA helicase DHR1 [Zalaria obscura]|uniref:ATP-dependent RNA helicase DHR1 n=1 Tax=Zalaria obscura TaxID=2024903 RepID=A0ACC3S740_9PEZI